MLFFLKWDILDLIYLLFFYMSILFMPEMPEFESTVLRCQYFTYFKSNLLFWALKILTLNAKFLKKKIAGAPLFCTPSSLSSFARCSPTHHNFIGSLTPPFFKKLKSPLSYPTTSYAVYNVNDLKEIINIFLHKCIPLQL